MIDQSVQMRSGSVGPAYHLDPPASPCVIDGYKGSLETMSAPQTPYPSSIEDVTMETTADKRSRESPDSTLKPEGKSLKTSEVATATATSATSVCAVDDGVPDTSNPQAPTIRWKPKTIPEARSLMWEVHQRMPAWKSDTLIESLKTEHVDLAALAEATGILFDSSDLLREAVKCLEGILNDKKREGSVDPEKGSESKTMSIDEKEVKRCPMTKATNTRVVF